MNVNTNQPQQPQQSQVSVENQAELSTRVSGENPGGKRNKALIGAAIALSVLVLVLVAVFVPGGILSRMDPFVGQWQLVDIDDGTEELNQDVEILNEMQVSMVLDVRSDGTATLGIEGDADSIAEPINMKWDKAGEQTVVFTTDEDETSATVDGNTLIMFQNEQGAMLFEKRV